MQIHIFDVEHGACNIIILPSGETVMVDCGHNGSTGWRPSAWVLANQLDITNLTITNMDEDHVSDLANVYRLCKPRSLSKNWNIGADWVRAAKRSGGMGLGVGTAVKMIEEYTGPSLATNWGGALVERFCHSSDLFQDENSLSLVTFIHYKGIRIVFPGDLTKEAWLQFLRNPRFVDLLNNTNIYVASHHGREDGYCTEVFEVCKPSVIIISDKGKEYETQEVDYTRHASGILWNGNSVRKVLTTRCDGKLTMDLVGENGFHITATG